MNVVMISSACVPPSFTQDSRTVVSGLTVQCVSEKAGLTNVMPSYKLCVEKGFYVQMI